MGLENIIAKNSRSWKSQTGSETMTTQRRGLCKSAGAERPDVPTAGRTTSHDVLPLP